MQLDCCGVVIKKTKDAMAAKFWNDEAALFEEFGLKGMPPIKVDWIIIKTHILCKILG